MKHSSLIITLLLLSPFSYGQTDSATYILKQIGMSIRVPNDFRLRKGEPAPTYLDENQNPITDTAVIDELTRDDPNILLDIETADGKNSISIVTIPISEAFKRFYADSAQYIEGSKKGVMAGTRQAIEKFDTLFSKVSIGNYMFAKLFTVGRIRGEEVYSGSYITKLNGQYLVISLFIVGTVNKDKLMKIVENARLN
jgi:hypothetical protein